MYDGPIEVFVTPGDVIYTSEVEKICVLTSYKPPSVSSKQLTSSLPSLDLDESRNLTSITNNIDGNSNSSSNAIESCSNSNVHTNQSSTEQVVEDNMNKIIESRTRHSHSHSHPHSQARSSSSVVIESLRESQQFDPLFNPPPTVVKPWQCALMVCVPVRLGESHVSPMYIQVCFVNHH